MVMKEDSLGVGVPGHQDKSKSRYKRRSQKRTFKNVFFFKFVVILISFELDKFCSLISFVG